MMMKSLSVLLLSLIMYPIYAFEMQGTLVDNSDGTYSVTLKDQTGDKQFYGNAYKQADGTLTMTVNGEKNETYIGTAESDHEGHFIIHLTNNTSGRMVTGRLEVQE